jgi:hypothetical protein
MNKHGLLGLVMLLGIGGVGSAMGQEPDPAAVKRLMDKYIRADEVRKAASKPHPKPTPKPRPAPAADHDLIAWQSAEKCGTAACFEAYMEDYPNGRYAKMAKARLKTEPESKPEPESRPAVVTERPAPAARPTNQRFTDNSDGTITDNRTGLIWLKNANCFGRQDWSTAMASARSLANGACGLRDGSSARQWRLPSKDEWVALIDQNARNPALPAGYPFTDIQSGVYHSSTAFAPDASFALGAWIYGGRVGAYGPMNFYVWPVRDGR